MSKKASLFFIRKPEPVPFYSEKSYSKELKGNLIFPNSLLQQLMTHMWKSWGRLAAENENTVYSFHPQRRGQEFEGQEVPLFDLLLCSFSCQCNKWMIPKKGRR